MLEFLDSIIVLVAPVASTLPRLVAALFLGGVVAAVYRLARSEPASSFTATLVLLAILIGMVTQVIGDNVARAFSLVGALSIVRFRTVLRDTEDTAYVICAVAVGMAVGANNFPLALGGLAVVAVAALMMRGGPAAPRELPFRLRVRVGLGHDPAPLVSEAFETYVATHRLIGVYTARQGVATEVDYLVALRADSGAHAMVTALNRLDGVQNVELRRVDEDDD